jgi:hypothetical protein
MCVPEQNTGKLTRSVDHVNNGRVEITPQSQIEFSASSATKTNTITAIW